MRKFTNKELASFALREAPNRQIEASLGRKMTARERAIVDKSRLDLEIRREEKKRKPKLGSSDRHTVITAERSKCDWRECEDPARRKKLEASPEKWLRYYLEAAYYRPFEKPHEEIIAGTMKAHQSNARFAVAAERGIGKSAVFFGLTLLLKLSGKHPFPAFVPWSHKALKKAFRFWRNALCFNDRLAADYPEYCVPFRHARGVAQRVITTTWRGGPFDGQPTGAQLTIGDGIIVFPNCLGCLGGDTINGNIRGLNHPQEDGSILRPTIILLDDVQNRKVAKSDTQIKDTIELIDSDVAGSGEAGQELPMLMSGNCIKPNDVMAHYLSSPQWQSLKVPCVLQWPTGFADEKSNCRKLWEEWKDFYLSESPECSKFYRKNKKIMTDGMKLSAPHAYKGKKGDPFYEVMKIYYKMGHDSFFAEKQQDPQRHEYSVYVLTPELVKSRVQDRAIGIIPEWTQTIIAATDINPSYALTSGIIGFGRTSDAAVLWYGLFKSAPLQVSKEDTKMEAERKIYEALALHGKELAGISCRPSLWVIDGGGTPEGTVIQFAANAPQICGIQTYCTFGRGWKTYRPSSRAGHKVIVGEQLHRVVERRDRQWIIYNSDYWTEVAQRGWTGAPGSPGSCSLPKGNHDEFATQICREQLKGKQEVGGRTVWVFETAPGPHDFADVMHMAYMAASFSGIGGSGSHPPQRKRYTQADFRR